jgi:hypothetical protein
MTSPTTPGAPRPAGHRVLLTALAAALLLALPTAAGATDLQWSAPQQIDSAGSAAIVAYACPSATQCTTVDQSGQAVTFNPAAVGDPGRALIVPGGRLMSLACPSTTQCIAGFQTFGLSFLSTTQRNVVTFNPQDPSSATTVLINSDGFEPASLSCPTATQCTAVANGVAGNSGAVVTFDPRTSSAPTRTTLDSTGALGSVSCPTATQCTAGGDAGRMWTFSPLSPGVRSTYNAPGAVALVRMTCPSTTQCSAIDNNNTLVTVDLTGPNETGFATSFPGFTISCLSNTACFTGDTDGNLIAFDPSHWADRTQTRISAASISVVCASATQCAVLGRTGDGIGAGAVNPAAPSAVTLTQIDKGGGLGGLWCPSDHQCSSINSVGDLVTFDPQDPAGRTAARLPAAPSGGIACPATTRCVMADQNGDGYTFDPHAPGGARPYALDAGHTPSGIACPSATQCVLIDQDGGMVIFDPTAPGGASRTEPIDGNPQLTILSCPTATQCTIASSGGGQIATFNPQAPAAKAQFSLPSGVLNLVCVTANECLATDYLGAREVFDPHVGQVTASSAVTGGRSPLYIACRTANACVWTTTTGALLQADPTVDGATATVSQVPGLNLSYGVACPSADLCAVVDLSGNLSVGTIPPVRVDGPGDPPPPAPPVTPPAPARPSIPVTPTRTTTVTDAAVRTLLGKLLAANGSLTPSFKAPAAGRLTITWTTRVGRRTVKVASGTFTYKKASTRAAKVKLKLTKAGKSLLKHHKKLKVTSKATYRMTGRRTITATRTFTLKAPKKS